MRSLRLIVIVLLLCLVIIFEREYPLVPWTWILIIFFSLRLKLSSLLIFFIALLADFAFSLPLGVSAIVVAGCISVFSLAPKKLHWRVLFFAVAGLGIGLLYAMLSQPLRVELLFFSSLLCVVLYSVGSTYSSIEEIGNVQD